MVDVVSPKTRSRMMSGIRGKNTKPELIIRQGLFRRGFRYRLHGKQLPGKPDLVFTRHRAVIFVHGCFWHRHECRLFKWPKSNSDFWREKLEGNVERDKRHYAALRAEGWRIMAVWECAVKGKSPAHNEKVLDELSQWLHSENKEGEITDKEDE